MIEALGRFAEALRAEGVAASPAELLDAVRALDALDLARRDRVKAALRATLAKDRKQARAFERVFDGFFVPPASAPGEGKGKKGRGGGGTNDPRAKGRAQPGEPQRGRLAVPKESRTAKPRSKESRRESPADEPRRAQERQRTDRLLERIRAGRPGRRAKIRVVRAPAESESAQRPAPGRPSEPATRRILAAPLSTKDEEQLAREIPRLIQEIRLKSARRLRRASTGRLWSARVFRNSLATGGVPFVLPFRRPRPRRPRVLLLVDVSWSVARSAGLFLWIASEFLRIGRDARVIAFVDRTADATEKVRRWLRRGPAPAGDDPVGVAARRSGPQRWAAKPGSGIVRAGVSFAQLLERLPELNLDAASDYGRAFHEVLRAGIEGGRRDTILVILGDGRSNRFDPLPWTLDEISRRCRAILWIAPEPASRWGTGDSRLADYLAYVDVLVEAHDLAGIARGVAEIARRV